MDTYKEFPAEMLPQKGERVRFLRHGGHEPDPLTPGEEGTVRMSNSMNIIVDWDSGRGLTLLPGIDVWAVISNG